MNDEYKDIYSINTYQIQTESTQNQTKSNPSESNIERTNTLRLTQEFNDKFFSKTRKSIEITHLSIMKDDIKNYRTLTETQLALLVTLSESEKIELIKTYNVMMASIETLLQ
jgi:hypothetical protein